MVISLVLPDIPPTKGKVSLPRSSPLSWTRDTLSSLQSNRSISLIAHENTQTSQSYPSMGTKGHSTLLSLQRMPTTATASSFHALAQSPKDPAWHMVSSAPGLWVYVTNKQILVCPVSGVLCSAISYYPSLNKGWIRGDQKKWLKWERPTIPSW